METLLKGWDKREDDCFWLRSDKVTETEWKAAHSARDEAALANSPRTAIPACMIALVQKVAEETPADAVELVINCWPYQLGKEVREAIAETMSELVGISVTTNFISPSFLTPSLIEEYDVVFDYYGLNWVSLHLAELMEKRIGTVLYYPRLYTVGNRTHDAEGNELSKDDLKRINGIDGFVGLEGALAMKLQMSALPVHMWNALPDWKL